MPSPHPSRKPSHTHTPKKKRKKWWRRHWKGLTGLITGIVVASVSPFIVDALRGAGKAIRGEKTPFTWTTQVDSPEDAPCHNYAVIPSKTAPTPSPSDDWSAWATRQGGVDADSVIIRLTLQGRTTESVVLHALRVGVDSRTAPRGFSYNLGNACGGMTARYFDVDLDNPKLTVAARAGEDGSHAINFPYQISSTEPEIFLVVAHTDNCDCRFHLDLDWTSGDRKGTQRILDSAKPFHVIGAQHLPGFVLGPHGRWCQVRPEPVSSDCLAG